MSPLQKIKIHFKTYCRQFKVFGNRLLVTKCMHVGMWLLCKVITFFHLWITKSKKQIKSVVRKYKSVKKQLSRSAGWVREKKIVYRALRPHLPLTFSYFHKISIYLFWYFLRKRRSFFETFQCKINLIKLTYFT